MTLFCVEWLWRWIRRWFLLCIVLYVLQSMCAITDSKIPFTMLFYSIGAF